MANYNSSHTGAEIDSAVGRTKDTVVTAGTVAASSAVVVDANKDISGFRNVTLTGQIQAATINLTGDTTIGDGDTDNITINADVNSNIIPNTDNTFDLGSASKQWKDLYVNGIGYIDQLGTDADPIAIYASSGEIDGTAIGSESASTGAFTTLTASGDVNFDSNTLFVDASENAVGIGTGSPTIPLVVGANGDPTQATIAAFINTNDGGVASIMIQNDAGGGSTDETNEIVSRTSNRRNGKIVFGREADQSSTANADSFLQLHTATDNVNNVALHIDSSQRVGIGTTSPDSILHIKGGANWRPILKIENTSTGNESGIIQFHKVASDSSEADDDYLGGIDFYGINSNNDSHRFAYMYAISSDVTDGTEDGRIDFMTAKAGTDTVTMTLKSGNVGIGTTSPSSLLEVKGTGETQIYINSASGYNSGVRFLENGTNKWTIGHDESDDKFFFYDFTVGDTVMVIESGGNVGIGTTSPSDQLTIANSGEASVAIIGSEGVGGGDATLYLVENSTSFGIRMRYDGGDDRLYINADEDTRNLMTIERDGTGVGIHTTSPNVGGYSSERGVLTISSTDNASLNNYANLELQGHAISNNVTVGDISFYDHTNLNAIVRGGRDSSSTTGFLAFFTNGGSGVGERLRLASDGEFLFQTARSGLMGTFVNDNGSTPYGIKIDFDSATPNNNTSYFITCQDSTNDKFIVYSDGDVQSRSNSYTGISDERLKENIVDATSKLDELNQVRVVNYNFKDEPDKKQLGVVAQELQEIFPKMVSEYGEDGYLGVKYSIFVPMLIKALQEADDKIDALTARIEALENA